MTTSKDQDQSLHTRPCVFPLRLCRQGSPSPSGSSRFSAEITERLEDLSLALDELPDDLEPLPGPPDLEDEPPWTLDSDLWVDEVHPIVDLLTAEMDWLGDVWQLLITLLDVRLMQYGPPDADDEEESVGGFGRHGDLVP